MHNYLTPNFVFAPLRPARALGSRVWDEDGREYIDFSGGIAVNALGHCHPELIAALTEQAQRYWHVSNYYTTAPAQNLARQLVAHSFADKVFFANSGAEANEAALKLARKHARDRFGAHKHRIIACDKAFHGRTLFTVSVGGQPQYSRDFAPLPEGITHIPFNDSAALEAAMGEDVCAVMIEPIQGESGVRPARAEFMQAARVLCDRFQAALIVDEVQTGIGRTGKLFAYEHYGIAPDILTSAKALGCGIPIGAMLAREHFAASLGPGSHGSTFGGNPLACAVAGRALEIIRQPASLAHAAAQGEKLQAALRAIGEEYRIFKEVRGMGLLIGAVLDDACAGQAAQFTAAALAHGLMLLSAGTEVVRFAPSLLLTDADLEAGLQRLRAAVTAFQAA